MIVLATLLTQCRKNTILTGSDVKLEFSNDTILFDTVFSTIGSTTHILKVFNTNNDPIVISDISIIGGFDSQYRMNVDGISGYQHSEIEIAANDSLFIFVEVTIDPNSFDLPFIVEDSISFAINGNHQQVYLLAYGQNAVFHGSLDELYVLEDDELTWDNNLPHVLYGLVVVDSCKTLTILPGTQIHCHSGSGLIVYKGTLLIDAFFNNEVVFQGDRLEEVFGDEPGQWGVELTGQALTTQGISEFTVSRGGIWLIQNKNSIINYAIIKNSVIGLQVDSIFDPVLSNSLTISNTKIFNNSAVGILAQGAKITGYNNLFANCGETCGLFSIGGTYKMDFCTFGNYWNFGTRQSPTFILRNYYEDINNNIQLRPFVDTQFSNCIMYGNNASQTDYSEFVIDMYNDDFSASNNFIFTDCYVDTENNISSTENYIDVHTPNNVSFVDPEMDDFHLISDFQGNYIQSSISGTADIETQQRESPPRVGCYK